MGTRGRDAALWLFFIIAGVLLLALIMGWNTTGKVFLYFMMLAKAALFFKFNLFDVPKAVKNSKLIGLKTIILLPLNKTWAGWLTGGKLGVSDYAEIHFDPKKINPQEELTGRMISKAIESDLLYIFENMHGIFLWETSISIPRSIRKIVKKHQAEGRAVWERGWWRIPHLPLVNQNSKKKPLRKGAIRF